MDIVSADQCAQLLDVAAAISELGGVVASMFCVWMIFR